MRYRNELEDVLKKSHVYAIVRECSRDLSYPVYVGGSMITYAVWEHVFGVRKLPDDLDLVYYDPTGDFCNEILETRVRDCTGLDVHAYNQARIHEIPKFSYRPPRESLEDAVRNYCDVPACTAVRRTDTGFDIIAPYGLDDLFAGRVRVTAPEYTAEVLKRARKKQWQATWPQVRVVDTYGAPLVVPPVF